MIHYIIYALGDSGITIEFAKVIDPKINDTVIALTGYLKDLSVEGVVDIIPAYSSVSVIYDIKEIRKKHSSASKYVTEQIEIAIAQCNSQKTNASRIVEIPVCYDVSLGIDLEEMSASKNLTFEEIIAIHTSKSYRVYLVGFISGFPYMGVVDEQIAAPRKKSPRTKIEAGSVGIAANQTGIYPFDSPGGWNIIGKTPIKMFDAQRDSPVYLQPGDEVVFKPITLEDFRNQESVITSHESGNNQREKLITQSSLLIAVQKQGIADSFQDLGRYGFQHLGINTNGAMDKIAAKAANFLVGNSENEAVLECHFPAGTIIFNADTLIAISGADFTPTIDEKEIPINSPVLISKGSTLAFKKWKSGVRIYMAVQNGFILDKWLGSYSTNTKAVAGGFHGRNLRSSDELLVMNNGNAKSIWLNSKIKFHVEIDNLYNFEEIEIVVGNDYKFLTNESKIKFLTNEFLISMRSDRMGYRLESEELFLSEKLELISSAVSRGTMQLLPNGQIIILMSDHQTTGGYPKIGHVTSASFSSLAQIPSNKKIRFKIISTEQAEENYIIQQNYLRQLQIGCKLRLKEFLSNLD